MATTLAICASGDISAVAGATVASGNGEQHKQSNLVQHCERTATANIPSTVSNECTMMAPNGKNGHPACQ
jgi:hypothetical protein